MLTIFNMAPENFNFSFSPDDTNVLFSQENLETLELIVNTELNNLFNWLTSNKLTLNIEKTNFVIFTFPRLIFLIMKKIRMCILEHKNCIKFLGLLINENLSWKDHVHTLTTKRSKTVALIAKLRHWSESKSS